MGIIDAGAASSFGSVGALQRIMENKIAEDGDGLMTVWKIMVLGRNACPP